jgi:hypothetical protein
LERNMIVTPTKCQHFFRASRQAGLHRPMLASLLQPVATARKASGKNYEV